MKFLLVGLLSVCGVLASVPAFAGCVEDIEVDSFVATITPATECVKVEDVLGTECAGGVVIQIRNECEETLTVIIPCSDDSPGHDVCGDYDPNHEILPGDMRDFGAPRLAKSTTWIETATLGEAELQIQVEFESRVTNEYDGCFSQTAGAGAAPFFLLALVAAFRRRLR